MEPGMRLLEMDEKHGKELAGGVAEEGNSPFSNLIVSGCEVCLWLVEIVPWAYRFDSNVHSCHIFFGPSLLYLTTGAVSECCECLSYPL